MIKLEKGQLISIELENGAVVNIKAECVDQLSINVPSKRTLCLDDSEEDVELHLPIYVYLCKRLGENR